MEKVSKIIANKIALELNLDNDRQEVIAYGMFVLMHIILSIALVAILGQIFGVLVQAIIISFTAAILRKYSGGVHASFPSVCMLIGSVVCVCEGMIVAIISRLNNLSLVIFLGLSIFVFSYYIIFKLAPVDCVNKPIKRKEKRIRMKKRSILVVSVYLVSVAVLIILYLNTNWYNALQFSLCIYAGLLWQVFTLTKLGHSFIKRIDAFLSYIIVKERGDII